MSLEQQVLILRERVRELEKQLVEKTKTNTAQSKDSNETQTSASSSPNKQQINDQTKLLSELKQEINSLYLKNDTLQVEIQHKNEKMKKMQMEILRGMSDDDYNKKLQSNMKQVEALMKIERDHRNSMFDVKVAELEEKVKIDKDIIIKLTEEIQNYKKSNTQLTIGSDKKVQGAEVSDVEINKLRSIIESIKQQKRQIQGVLQSSVVQAKSFKEKYHKEITKSNQHMQSISMLRNQLTQSQQKVKAAQKQNSKLLLEQISRNTYLQNNSSKETQQTEMNTEPMRTPKKSGTYDSSYLNTPSQQTKNNESLMTEINNKNNEIKQLLKKIDAIQVQNNKLLGGIQSVKRDLDSKKEMEKILQKNIEEQKSVIESQRNTINSLQKQQSDCVEQYEIKVQMLSKKLSLYSIPEERSKVQLDFSNQRKQKSEQSKHSQSKSKSKSQHSKQPEIVEEDVTDFPMLTIPIVNNISQSSKMSSSVDYQRSDEQYRVAAPVSPNSPSGYVSPSHTGNTGSFSGKPKIKKLQFEKLEKKFSSITSNDRNQPLHSKKQQLQTRTVSARGLKSGRTITPADLKLSIKNILDNSVLLGKGVEFIQMILQLVIQVEAYSGYPYQDVVIDLEKKKELEKTAFNANLMKQLVQISKVKHQCQQTVERYKVEFKQKLNEKQEIINQLRQQNLKHQTDREQQADKIQKLQTDIQKNKKVESQKELTNKNNMSKSTQDIGSAVQKLKQEKALISQKLQKYQQSIQEYDIMKKKMYAENEKLKSQLLYFKSQFAKIRKWVEHVEKVKYYNMDKANNQFSQVFDIVLEERLRLGKRNDQLIIQLKDKQQSLQVLVEEADILKQQLKARQNDLIQIGRQIHQINEIRSNTMRLEIEEQRQSVVLLRQQEVHLKAELKDKQEMIVRMEKELSRQKTDVSNLQKQLDEEKQKNKLHQMAKRELTDQLTSHLNIIRLLEKRLVVVEQQESYQTSKKLNEFQQVMDKIFAQTKKQKQKQKLSKLKNPTNNNAVLKTVSSTKVQNEHISNDKMGKQYKQMKQMFKLVASSIYETYAMLPIITDSTMLFEAETQQQLVNQLKDIEIFAQNYTNLKNEIDTAIRRTEQNYITLMKKIIKNQDRMDESKLSNIIADLKISSKQQDKLKASLPLIFSSKDLQEMDKSKRKVQIQEDL